MSTEYSLPSRNEMLAHVVRQLHAEFPAVASDQVVRCVQIARESAKSVDPSAASAPDPTAYVDLVETQARNYLAKFEAIRAGSTPPPNPTVVDLSPTVVELGAAEGRRRGRHRRNANASHAVA
jgi:hypothetical protein